MQTAFRKQSCLHLSELETLSGTPRETVPAPVARSPGIKMRKQKNSELNRKSCSKQIQSSDTYLIHQKLINLRIRASFEILHEFSGHYSEIEIFNVTTTITLDTRSSNTDPSRRKIDTHNCSDKDRYTES